jgi:hypothetical protein
MSYSRYITSPMRITFLAIIEQMRETSQRAVRLPLPGQPLYTWREVIFIISFPSLPVEDNWWPSNGSIGFLDNSWPAFCQMHIVAILKNRDRRGAVWYVKIIGSRASSLIVEFPFATRSYKCCNTGSLWPLYQPCRPSSILALMSRAPISFRSSQVATTSHQLIRCALALLTE